MGSDFLEAPFCNNRTSVILNVTRAGKFTFVMCMLSIIVCIVHNFGACIINFYHIRLFKVNIGRNTRKRCEICSKLTKTLERLHWRYSAAFTYLWTYFTPFSIVSIANFEQANVSWDRTLLQSNMKHQSRLKVLHIWQLVLLTMSLKDLTLLRI